MWPSSMRLTCLRQQSEHALDSCLLQDCLVWNAVLPSDDQNPSEAAHVEGVEPALLPRMQCFTAVKWCAEHAGLVHLHLGADG